MNGWPVRGVIVVLWALLLVSQYNQRQLRIALEASTRRLRDDAATFTTYEAALHHAAQALLDCAHVGRTVSRGTSQKFEKGSQR